MIQRLVEDPLSEKILWKEFHAGETIIVDVLDDEIVFRAIEGIEPPPVELAGSGTRRPIPLLLRAGIPGPRRSLAGECLCFASPPRVSGRELLERVHLASVTDL